MNLNTTHSIVTPTTQAGKTLLEEALKTLADEQREIINHLQSTNLTQKDRENFISRAQNLEGYSLFLSKILQEQTQSPTTSHRQEGKKARINESEGRTPPSSPSF